MATPSPALVSNPLDRALDHLASGAWRQAHDVGPPDTSTLAAWRHGIVDIRGRHLDNARGWYEPAEHPFPGARPVEEKLAAARRAPEAWTR